MPDTDIARIRSILDRVTYKDWSLEFRLDSQRNLAPYVRWRFNAKCAKTGDFLGQAGRKWYLSPYMTESELVLTAFKAALTAEEHECREHFKYQGYPILNPHISVQALLSVFDKEDVRPQK